MLIHHFLEKSAERFPDKVALIADDVRETFAGVNALANRVARWLLALGVAPGDRVALLLENSLEYVAAYYGILKAAGVAAPLSSDLKPEGLRDLLLRLDGKALITSGRFEEAVRAALSSYWSEPAGRTAPSSEPASCTAAPALLIHRPRRPWSGAPCAALSWDEAFGPGATGGGSRADTAASNPDLSIGESDLASVIFTSGSTGTPKGVMLTHGNVAANTAAICRYLELTSADRQMVVLPFHYVMGKSLLNTHFAVGGSVVLNNRFAYPAEVIRQMEVEEVTGFSGVPSTYAYLLHRSPLRAYRDRLPSLRYCSQAGGHLAPHLKEELQRVLPGHTRFFVMYGATEASARLTYLPPDLLPRKLDSIGRPIDGVEIRVVDEAGRELDAGETGELVASGPNIMAGYWRDPEATAAALGPLGYRTGDLGYRDPEGDFFLTGRKDEQLKVGGHRVNPREIEDALLATGLLVQAAVVGVPDPLLGQRLAALAVPVEREASAAEILRRGAERLPRSRLPAEIRLVARLPQSASGKIDRERCRELLQESRGE